MLNSENANEELHARLYEILLKARLCGLFSNNEVRDLCFACGVSIPWPHHESNLERLQRMAREAEEWRKQHDQEAAQAALRG